MARWYVPIATILLAGCSAGGNVVSLSESKIDAPRILAYDAPSAPWSVELQRRLREKGFKVMRWRSNTRITEQTSPTRSEGFDQADARYVLVVEGEAPLDTAHRCFGGGFNFSHINVDLIDTETSETLLNVSGSGYSEGCAPLSGTIFGDIVEAVDGAWAPR